MPNLIRYALATFCFAASVGCLGLWWRSMTRMEQVGGSISKTHTVHFLTFRGFGVVGLHDIPNAGSISWAFRSERIDPAFKAPTPSSRFRTSDDSVFFPLWYASLVSALTGVGVLRFTRQFSIRSALICVSVVAALLGMVVAL